MAAWQNWRSGFWTGAALASGDLANHWWNGSRTAGEPVRRTAYDWERVRRPSFFGRGRLGVVTDNPPHLLLIIMKVKEARIWVLFFFGIYEA